MNYMGNLFFSHNGEELKNIGLVKTMSKGKYLLHYREEIISAVFYNLICNSCNTTVDFYSNIG